MQEDVYGLGGRGSDVMVWNATSAGLGHHTLPIHTVMGRTTQDALWLLGSRIDRHSNPSAHHKTVAEWSTQIFAYQIIFLLPSDN